MYSVKYLTLNKGMVQWTDTYMGERKGWTQQTEYQLQTETARNSVADNVNLKWICLGQSKVSVFCISNSSYNKIVLLDFIHCLISNDNVLKTGYSFHHQVISGERTGNLSGTLAETVSELVSNTEKPHVRYNKCIILGFSVLLLPSQVWCWINQGTQMLCILSSSPFRPDEDSRTQFWNVVIL
jgi:hypothetical protein